MIPNNSAPEVKLPDFQALLDGLVKEVATAHQLTSRVSFSSNLLKKIERNVCEAKNPAKEPESLIDYLWEQVWSLRRSNEEMGVVANHLQSLVGN